jgi:hypothetical protein
MGEGLRVAFSQVAYHNGDEGQDEEATNEHQGQVIRPSPSDVEPPEKFEDGILEDPKTACNHTQRLAIKLISKLSV